MADTAYAGPWGQNPIEAAGSNLSPFGACAENYNEMTEKFWRQTYPTYSMYNGGVYNGVWGLSDSTYTGEGDVLIHGSGSTPGVDAGGSAITGATPVFIDEVNMAYMNIQPGPDRGVPAVDGTGLNDSVPGGCLLYTSPSPRDKA